jgi:Tol biopolymer transport system component
MTMSSPQRLSTFWKRRLNMLLATSQTAPSLSRRAVLGIVGGGLLASLPPAFRNALVHAEPQQGQAEAKAMGRIYVSCTLQYKPEGKDEEEKHYGMIIAIDLDTVKWQKMTDKGYDVRVSPDRQTLVFASDHEIWNCDTGGSNNPGKISNLAGDGRPIWSPDGKHLVATKQKHVDGHGKDEPAWKDETWLMDADGANPVRLPVPDTDSVDDWSPDGQWFVTCSDRHLPHGSGYQLYVMKTDGTQQRRITEGGLNCHARFSPDGRKIFYGRQTAEEVCGIWVVDVDGKNAREILKEVDLVVPNGAFWSPNGKQIAVPLSNWELDEKGRKVGGLDPEKANYRIEIMDADGENRRELKLADAKFLFIGALGDWR